MTTELATRPSVSVSLNITTISDLRDFCKILAGTEMVPKAYINKPDNILVAMLHGQEVGLPHLQALQCIAVINGIPSIYGDAALSLVRASGLLEDIDEWVEVDGVRQEGPFPIMALAKEEKSIVALTMTKRKGMRPRTTSFSVDDAGRAGLWGKAGPWSSVPQRMLMWRARSWNLRDNFGDVLKGLAIYEEAQDIDTERNESGVCTVSVQEEEASKARLLQVQEQLKAKQDSPSQETASTGTEAPTSEESKSPPSDIPSGGGPGHMTPQEWSAMLLYLDADPERMKVKNKTKLALGMKPLDKLNSLLAVKQVEFITKLMQIAKQEGVEIAF